MGLHFPPDRALPVAKLNGGAAASTAMSGDGTGPPGRSGRR
ncbi:MAG TPA: hypothetical protein VFY53_00875 [Rhodoplanes sp.]|nr:hypothetical protein [Rhodoplanes sp.]